MPKNQGPEEVRNDVISQDTEVGPPLGNGHPDLSALLPYFMQPYGAKESEKKDGPYQEPKESQGKSPGADQGLGKFSSHVLEDGDAQAHDRKKSEEANPGARTQERSFFLSQVWGSPESATEVLIIFTSPGCRACHKALLDVYTLLEQKPLKKGYALIVRYYPSDILSLYLLGCIWSPWCKNPSQALCLLKGEFSSWALEPIPKNSLEKALKILQSKGLIDTPSQMDLGSLSPEMLNDAIDPDILEKLRTCHHEDKRLFGIQQVPCMYVYCPQGIGGSEDASKSTSLESKIPAAPEASTSQRGETQEALAISVPWEKGVLWIQKALQY